MKKIILLISIFFTLIGFSKASEVNIFSARHYDSDVQLYEKFTKKTAEIEGVLNQKVLSIEEGASLKIKTETYE